MIFDLFGKAEAILALLSLTAKIRPLRGITTNKKIKLSK